MALTPTGYYSGNTLSYQLTNGLIQDVEPGILLLDDTALPLLNGRNFNNQAAPLLGTGSQATQKKIEWQEETLLAPQATITATITSGVVTAVVGAAHQKKFQVDDIVRTPAGEYVRVTAYSGTDSLTIVRGFNSSSAATITSGDLLQVVANVGVEGGDPGVSRVADRAFLYNYTQIWKTKLSMSDSDRQIARWGVSDEFGHQLHNRMVEQGMSREQSLVLGTRQDDTSNFNRSAGGIDYFVRANGNNDSTTTALDAAAIAAAMLVNYGNGATPYELLINPQRLNTLNDPANTSIVREWIDNGMRGRTPVTFVATEFGDVRVIRSRWVPIKSAYLVMFDRMSRRPFRSSHLKPLAATGDSESVMLACEESFEIKGSSQMSVFTGLTTN